MLTYPIGRGINEGWTVYDALTGLPITGITSGNGVTLTLTKRSGATWVAAAETVTWTEIGVTGIYLVSFTPSAANSYRLLLTETHASSAGRSAEYFYASAGSIILPNYTNAFCSENDLERWLQTEISGDSEPDDVEATAFAEARAAILMALLGSWGYTVTPSTVVSGSVLEDMLREANAIGAALDYTIAQQFKRAPLHSERTELLEALWQQYTHPRGTNGKDDPGGYLAVEIKGNLVGSLATDFILSGDTLANAAASVAATNQPIGIGMGDLF